MRRCAASRKKNLKQLGFIAGTIIYIYTIRIQSGRPDFVKIRTFRLGRWRLVKEGVTRVLKKGSGGQVNAGQNTTFPFLLSFHAFRKTRERDRGDFGDETSRIEADGSNKS